MRILVAVTGASGLQYSSRLVSALNGIKGVDCKVVVSSAAGKVAEADGVQLPKANYSEFDFSCPYASGSNPPDAMVIIPCSLKTLGEISNGVGNSLITRAAEVVLKERKKLILVVRETPYSLIFANYNTKYGNGYACRRARCCGHLHGSLPARAHGLLNYRMQLRQGREIPLFAALKDGQEIELDAVQGEITC